MKIYTKTGDSGMTSLLGGERVTKSHIRIEAYGAVDELNAHIGYLRELPIFEPHKELITEIQCTLFVIGSHLANSGTAYAKLPEFNEGLIAKLEASMDEMDATLPKLKHFILPGGSQENAFTHICRTICRRTERQIVHLHEAAPISTAMLTFINRLSDWFFILARWVTLQEKAEEIIWK